VIEIIGSGGELTEELGGLFNVSLIKLFLFAFRGVGEVERNEVEEATENGSADVVNENDKAFGIVLEKGSHNFLFLLMNNAPFLVHKHSS